MNSFNQRFLPNTALMSSIVKLLKTSNHFSQGPHQCYCISSFFVSIRHIGHMNPTHFSQNICNPIFFILFYFHIYLALKDDKTRLHGVYACVIFLKLITVLKQHFLTSTRYQRENYRTFSP